MQLCTCVTSSVVATASRSGTPSLNLSLRQYPKWSASVPAKRLWSLARALRTAAAGSGRRGRCGDCRVERRAQQAASGADAMDARADSPSSGCGRSATRSRTSRRKPCHNGGRRRSWRAGPSIRNRDGGSGSSARGPRLFLWRGRSRFCRRPKRSRSAARETHLFSWPTSAEVEAPDEPGGDCLHVILRVACHSGRDAAKKHRKDPDLVVCKPIFRAPE